MNKTEDLYAKQNEKGEWIYTKDPLAFTNNYERKYRLKVKRWDKMMKVSNKSPTEKGQLCVSDKGVQYKIYRIINEPYVPYEIHLENMKEIIKNYPPPRNV